MTNEVGRRIAQFRKKAGFDTAASLAAAIANPKISGAVIQNLESGRKVDIALYELLEIAYAVHVSPVVLIAPIDRPFDRVSIPNVVGGPSKMTNSELDSWISASGNESVESSGILTSIVRREIRKLLRDLDYWMDTEEDGVEVSPSDFSSHDEYLREHKRVEDRERREHELRGERIDHTREMLAANGWDVSWITKPLPGEAAANG